MTLTAVIFDRRHMTIFGPEVPPDLIDAIHNFGGRIVEGVTLEKPEDSRLRVQGARPTLGVSPSDPKRYRVFEQPSLVNGDFEPSSRVYAIIDDPQGWQRLTRGMEDLVRLESITDETETDESWAEFDRLMSGQAG